MRYKFTRVIPIRPLLSILMLAFSLGGVNLFGQIVRIDNPTDSVAFCSGFFVDQGVFNGPHGTGDADTITICSNSSDPDRTHILLSFTQLDLQGEMNIYDGTDTDAPIIATFDNETGSEVFFIQATAANPSGCLTIVFTPDGSGTAGAGWSSTISCVSVCQEVIANIGLSVPEVSPPDTGYIDICLGDPIQLVAQTLYPQNGLIYDQSDTTSTLRWTMGDGTTYDDISITHTYQDPGGYIIELFVTDINGCMSTNLISQRVRVAPIPAFQLQNPTEVVCTDEPFNLSASSVFDPDASTNIFVATGEEAFGGTLTLADTTFLPDGPNDPEYTTSLEFTNFFSGSVLEDISDLEGICLNMEHSYVGDLDIWIQCPNGTEVQLVEHQGPGNNLFGQFLGIPIDNDADLTPGVGFDYCFTTDGEFTWNEAVDVLDINGGESIPAGDYASVQPLDDLLGCPLNGQWTIRVRDNLAIDNGYIFSWTIGFNPDLLANVERFTVGFEETFWSPSPNIVTDNGDDIDASSPGAGPQPFVYNVVDEFGCTYDTTLIVNVLPVSDPDCYECPPLLAEESADFSGAPGEIITIGLDEADSSIPVPWQVTPMTEFSNQLFPGEMVPYESAVAVTTIVPTTINDATQDIISVCVDIETPATGDVQLFLRAPNGTLLPLSTNNGGFGSDFSGTCFTPDAATAITDGAAPFTGDFQPEGDWSSLNGSSVNGIWSIVAWDEGLDEELGQFLSWSITFRYQDEIMYSWEPTDGLSCTDCPDPTITLGPDVNQTYTLTVFNDRDCSESGTVTVTSGSNLVVQIEGTDPSCSDVNDGTVSVSVMGGTEPYTISWDPPAEGFELMDLGAGVYSATVTDDNGDSVVVAAQLVAPDPLVISETIVNVNCAGDSTGSISLAVTGGTGEYTYSWTGTDADGPVVENLPAGTYSVVITDENECVVEASYTIVESEPLVLMAEAMDVACNGDSTGMIVLMVTGGSGNYTYEWSNGAETEDLFNVPAGAYTVTVTDSLGCEATNFGTLEEPETEDALNADQVGYVTIDDVFSPIPAERIIMQVDTIFVNEPSALDVAITLTDVQCVGDSTGSISLDISGGTPPYEVFWNIDAEGTTLENLPAGIYSATVMDANGCTFETGDLEITGISQLNIEFEATDPLCNGDANGTIIPTVSGGTEPYDYAWSDESDEPSRDDLTAGTYGLTVTDVNGCSASIDGIELLDPPLLTCEVFVIQEPAMGNDGSIYVVATGGTGEYAYDWSNGGGTDTLENLAPGNYEVTVTDENGCTTTCAVELQAFATIGDYVWNDEDRDGFQDPEEEGLANRTVNLINQDNPAFSQSTETDADGRYEFTAIAGNYVLTFERPNGFAASPKDAFADDVDSDINLDGSTDVITLMPDEENFDVDAGFFDPCFPPITFAGTIGFDQEVCGAGNVPDLLVELEPAINGGDGELNYLWMKRAFGSNQWMPIPNTNTINYQPGPVFESTYFTRCVRRDECVYIESNAILVTVRDDAVANISGPNLTCENSTVTFVAEGVGPDAEISWNFGFAATVTTSDQPLVEVEFISFGSFVVTLSVTENGCTATATHPITVTNNPVFCADRPGLSTIDLPAGELLTEVFPNPTDGRAWLDIAGSTAFAGQDMNLQVIDARGRVIATRKMPVVDGRIELSELNGVPQGMYLLRVALGDELRTHRIVVR